MAICVKSEIGALKKVLLHRPGKELEHLVPEELERLCQALAEGVEKVRG